MNKDNKHTLGVDHLQRDKEIIHSESDFMGIDKVIDDTPHIDLTKEQMPKEILEALRSVKEVREDKVNQLKKEIENGSYAFDDKKLERVAENMINAEDLVINILEDTTEKTT